MKHSFLSDDEFFKLVATSAGSVEPDTVRRIYNGMLRVVYAELRQRGNVRLPALCELYLLLQKGKRIQNRHMASSVVKKPFRQVRITPMAAIKNYFTALDERSQ